MKPSRLAVRLVPPVLAAFAAGAIVAQADSGPARPRPVTAPVPKVRAVAAMRALVTQVGPPSVFAVKACEPTDPSAKPAPPSQDLLNAFAVLRRERKPEDALTPEALKALERVGLAPVSADSARLLRSTASGGKAWVVPVPDARRPVPFTCIPRAAKRGGAKLVRPRRAGKPVEGVAVIAFGDAADGGGGTLPELVRGRAPVSVNACAGPDRNMLGISGIVPDGVPAVFLTAPDGTAVKADVKDNGYEFLVPHPKQLGQRYVVWTGGDGTPHVQPIAAVFGIRAGTCVAKKLAPAIAARPRITPNGFGSCVGPPQVDVWVRRPPKTRPRPAPAPATPLLFACGAEPGLVASAPTPTPLPVVPARPRPTTPKKHK